MSVAKVLLVTALAGTLSIGIALLGERWLDLPRRDATVGAAAVPGQRAMLPELRLPDLDGHEVISNSWAGRIVILNYWATWCPPCLAEMPLLMDLQQRYGDGVMQVVGIAIDEPEAVRRFVAERPVNYPILLGGVEAVAVARALGNRVQGLPFTAVFDASGRRVFSRTGEIDAATLREVLLPLLPPPDSAPVPAL